jgi:antitoxin CptB
MQAELLNERDLSKLRWRCRRGLLENDLFIERFFNKFEKLARKTIEQVSLSAPALDCTEAREVLKMLQNKA